MTFLEVRNSILPSSSGAHPSQPPRLNTETPNASLYPSPDRHHSPPSLSPIQVGTLSVSPITSGIRADHPRTTTMPPDTRSSEFKRMEESITAVRQDSGQKYEMLMDMLKGQGIKLDQTIENQGAQINDIRNMMGTMAQQIEFTLLKLSHTPGDSSHNMQGTPQIQKEQRVETRDCWRTGYLATRYTNQNIFSRPSMGKMCTNGFSNAHNTLRWKMWLIQKNYK